MTKKGAKKISQPQPTVSAEPPPPAPMHTPEMQDAELRQMLSGDSDVTAGTLMALWLARSPYLTGGLPAPTDDELLLRLTGSKDIPGALDALDTALRPLLIIKSEKGARLPKSYDGYGPEWLADLIAAACRALPSLEWRTAVWDTPLCLLAHLAAAAHRSQGGRTERPMDYTEQDKWLLAANGISK